MNTITEHDRKLAETLKSLSLEPSPRTFQSPKKSSRRLVLFVSLPALVVASCLPAVFWPEAVHRFKSALLGRSGTAADSMVSDSEAVDPPRDRGESRHDEISVAPKAPLAIAREVTGSGYVVAPRATTVFSKYEGRITDIAVEMGDRVAAGQVLVTLDDANARFALEQAKAAKISADLVLAARNIALAQTRASLDRIESLAAREAASRQRLEEARYAWESARNNVAQAQQDISEAELAIRIAEEAVDELTVRAPFAGTITRLNAHIGDTVLARADSVRENQSLLTITDTGSMVIDADVAETSVAALRPGLRGEAVLDGFPDRAFGIVLTRLAPVVSAEKGTIALRLSLIAPPDGIRPNMAARIRVNVIDSQTGERQHDR
jgi:RND family efflux transporter MFP subunit